MITKRQSLIASGLTILAFVLIAGLIYGTTGAFTARQYNERLVLSDDSSQHLVDGNWTDVYFDRTVLTNDARWMHPSITPVESAHVIAQQSGRFDIYFAVHIVPDILSVSCSNIGAPCVVDGDCCQSQLVAQFCHTGTLQCTSCGNNSGVACSPGGDLPVYVPCCRPGLTCTGDHGTCEAPTDAPTEAPTAAPSEVPTTAPTAVPTEAPTAAPSATPTKAPTGSPTAVPSAAPTTEEPTEEPTPAPTSELSEATIDIAACLTYTRVMLQRSPDPTFYQVGADYVPQLTGDLLLTVISHLHTQGGDVYKFQWITDCLSMSLSPTPIDLGLLGVPNEGVQSISAYLVAAPSL